jgi:hypothetical protein
MYFCPYTFIYFASLPRGQKSSNQTSKLKSIQIYIYIVYIDIAIILFCFWEKLIDFLLEKKMNQLSPLLLTE